MAVKNYGKPKKSENPLANVEPDNYEASIISVEEAENQGGLSFRNADGSEAPPTTRLQLRILLPELDGLVVFHSVNIPRGLEEDGRLSSRSNIWKIMSALGYDMDTDDNGNMNSEVDPNDWLHKPFRVSINDKVIQAGVNEGKIRRDIVDYLKAKPGQKAPPPPDEGFD